MDDDKHQTVINCVVVWCSGDIFLARPVVIAGPTDGQPSAPPEQHAARNAPLQRTQRVSVRWPTPRVMPLSLSGGCGARAE